MPDYLPGRTVPSCRGNMVRAVLLCLLWFPLALLGIRPAAADEAKCCGPGRCTCDTVTCMCTCKECRC